jgi:hypothetical protein
MMAAKIGVDLDLFRTLVDSERPLSTADLVRETSAEPELLLRLLKFLASIYLVREVGPGLWGPSNASRNMAGRNIAAGVHHKYVCLFVGMLGLLNGMWCCLLFRDAAPRGEFLRSNWVGADVR